MKKRLIIGITLIIAISGGVLAGCSGNGGSNAEQASGYIQVPDGPKIKVVFNGPSELTMEWEKLGMAGFQVQLIGTLRNVSNQAVKFSEIGFLFDGYQVAYIQGRTLQPGEEMEILKGFPGYTENTKILEVRIKGFERIGAPTTVPTEITPSTEEVTKVLPSEVTFDSHVDASIAGMEITFDSPQVMDGKKHGKRWVVIVHTKEVRGREAESVEITVTFNHGNDGIIDWDQYQDPVAATGKWSHLKTVTGCNPCITQMMVDRYYWESTFIIIYPIEADHADVHIVRIR